MKISCLGGICKKASFLFVVVLGSVAPLGAQQVTATTSTATPSTATSSGTTSTPVTSTDSQAASDASWEGVRTVVVTATRQETEIAKTGTSINVVSSQEIERKQYRTAVDALEEVPGVNVIPSGYPGQTTAILIRGVATSGNSVLMDGRELPFNLAGGNSLEMFSLANIDRVEVERGPSSSVSGGPAMGGVINLISRDGRGQETPQTETFMEAGSYNTIREGVSSWGSEGAFDYSTGSVRTDAQYSKENGNYRSWGNNTKLGYQINPDLYFDTRIIYVQDEAGTPGSVSYHNPNAGTLRELWGVSPGLTWKTTEIWKQSVYYGHYQYRQDYNNPTDPYYSDPSNRVQVDTNQINYQSQVQIFDNWNMTAGASVTDEHYYYKLDTPGYDYSTWAILPGGSTPLDGHDTKNGYFAESQWEILPGWNLINNARFDHYSDFSDAFTYRAATSYEVPTVKTILHANYGTSYAPPSGSDTAEFWGGKDNLKPEKSKGYEFGVSQPFAQDKVSVFGTWFHNDIDDLIVWNPDSYGNYVPSNVARAVLEGVETGVTYKPIKQVRLKLSYTNLSALQKDENVTSRLTYRPRQTVNATVTYMPIDPLTFTLGGSYIADRVDSSGALEDYLNLRFTAAWKINRNVEVYGRIENLTNDQYELYRGYPTLDQAFYGGVKVTF